MEHTLVIIHLPYCSRCHRKNDTQTEFNCPQIIYDEKNNRASGVRVIDSETNEVTEYKAKIIFLCASTIASTSILLQSVSDRFPNGLGNDSGELGHNLMDHHLRLGASAEIEGLRIGIILEEGPEAFIFQDL